MIEVGATTGNQGKITPSFASAIGTRPHSEIGAVEMSKTQALTPKLYGSLLPCLPSQASQPRRSPGHTLSWEKIVSGHASVAVPTSAHSRPRVGKLRVSVAGPSAQGSFLGTASPVGS